MTAAAGFALCVGSFVSRAPPQINLARARPRASSTVSGLTPGTARRKPTGPPQATARLDVDRARVLRLDSRDRTGLIGPGMR
jgi:hypothetical protein